MPRLYLVASSQRLGHAPAAIAAEPGSGERPVRRAPHLRLVPDTGSQYRAHPRGSEPRRHSWPTLLVAATAIAAAVLVSTIAYDQALPGGIASAPVEQLRPLPFAIPATAGAVELD